MTWARQGIKQIEEIGMKKEDGIDKSRRCDAVN